MSIEGLSINGVAHKYVYGALEETPKDLSNIVTNDTLQNGTYNIVTPSIHIGTWRETAHEFGPATNRVTFDAIQPFTGAERVYTFDENIDIFLVGFDSDNQQLGYSAWISREWNAWKSEGYYDLSYIKTHYTSLADIVNYLLIFRFHDNRTITDASEIMDKVLIVNNYEGGDYREMLVMGTHNISNTGAAVFEINRTSKKVKIDGVFYIYLADGNYTKLNVSNQPLEFSLTNGQTLVLDTSEMLFNTDHQTDNSSAVKVVSYSAYDEKCIPVCNCRVVLGTISQLFVTGPFAQFIVDDKTFDKSSLKLETFKEEYYPYTMRNSGSGWTSRVNLLHITDTHIGETVSYNNLLESIDVGNDLFAGGIIKAVINTGDNTNGGGSSLSNFLAQYTKNTAALATSTAPYLMQLGNHDANNGQNVAIADVPTNEDLFPPFANIFAQSGVVAGDATNKKRYYYYDITQGNHSIRVIMLDMLDHADYTGSNTNYECQWNTVYSQSQIDWLANTALDVPDGYGVIIANHFPFAPHRDAGYSEQYAALNDGYFVQSATGSVAGGWQMIPEIVQAWQNRTTISKTYTDTKGDQDIIANYDFSDVPTGAVFVCYLTGHTHSKNVYKVEEENGVSFDQLMLCEDSSGQNGVALNRVYKKTGTIADNAFSCLSIDMDEKKIYRTSYGVYKKCSDPTVAQTQVFSFDFSE